MKETQKVFPNVIKEMPRPIPPVAGYAEMMEGLKKDEEGKHKKAMRLYEKAGELGNKAAFLNMGNCYMFGKGVKEDRWKGVEMYGRCGRISSEEVGWMRKLSNDRFFCEKELGLEGLFFLLLSWLFL